MSRPHQDDRILGLEPALYPPTARELAESQDVREEFLRRVAARRGVQPSALRDAMRRHAVAADEIDLERGGGVVHAPTGNADEPSKPSRGVDAMESARGASAARPAPLPGCAEAWPHLPTGAAGADLPAPSIPRSARWPGAGRLLSRALRLLACALIAGAALALVALAAVFDGN